MMLLNDVREGRGFPVLGGTQASVHMQPIAFKGPAVSPKLQKNPY